MKLPLLLLSVVLALTNIQAQTPASRVLVIGIDGVGSDALTLAYTANINYLIENDVHSPDALNADITISGPGWTSILCGVHSDKHLVTYM